LATMNEPPWAKSGIRHHCVLGILPFIYLTSNTKRCFVAAWIQPWPFKVRVRRNYGMGFRGLSVRQTVLR
jgi:hypothetical protein